MPLDEDKGECFFKADSHLRALVRLGYFEKKVFILEHVRTSTPQAKKLLSALYNSGICEEHIITSNDVGDDENLKITIWVSPKYMPQYEMLINDDSLEY